MNRPLSIVLIEDHDALREVTAEALIADGHYVTSLSCAESLADEIDTQQIDLYILDLMLPGEDGLSLAKRIRASNTKAGIIMLTARTQTEDRTAGYFAGADIYLSKPTHPIELRAAVQALARRLCDVPSTTTGTCTLDLTRLELQGATARISLSALEAQQLTAFVHAKAQQLESWQLIALAHRPVDEASKKALEVQMVRLRKKLAQAGAPQPSIKALRGVGYQLCTALSLTSSH